MLTVQEHTVNSPTEPSRTQIWAHVHGEQPDAERRAFEQALSGDPALRRSVAATHLFDQRLRAGFAVLEADETVWADRALAAWEREQEAPRTVSWTRRLRWPLVAALAAAAALVLLLSTPADPQALQWDHPAFAPLVMRGSAPANTPARLTSTTASDCDRALRAAVASACCTHNLVPRPGLTLAVRVQELPHGAFAVTVRARNRAGAQVQEWNGDYSSVASFNSQLPASAQLIAEALAVVTRP